MKKLTVPAQKSDEKTTQEVTPKSQKLISAWKLFTESCSEFADNWKRYTAIIAVVAVPGAVLSLINVSSSTPDAGIAATVSFASLIMNVALIWAISQHDQTGSLPTIREAYYDGSAAIVRFLIVTGFLLAVLVFAALGVSLYTLGVNAATYTVITPVDEAILNVIAVLIAIPSIYWVVRRGLSWFIVINDGIRPLAAWRRSQAVTKGRFWKVLGRLVLLALFSLMFLIPEALLAVGLAIAKLPTLGSTLFSLAATLTALPITNIYLLRLYEQLSGKSSKAQAETA